MEVCVCAGYMNRPVFVHLREPTCILQVQQLHVEQRDKSVGFSRKFSLMDPVGWEPGAKLVTPCKAYLKFALFSGWCNLKISENQVNSVPRYEFQKITTGYWL